MQVVCEGVSCAFLFADRQKRGINTESEGDILSSVFRAKCDWTESHWESESAAWDAWWKDGFLFTLSILGHLYQLPSWVSRSQLCWLISGVCTIKRANFGHCSETFKHDLKN